MSDPISFLNPWSTDLSKSALPCSCKSGGYSDPSCFCDFPKICKKFSHQLKVVCGPKNDFRNCICPAQKYFDIVQVFPNHSACKTFSFGPDCYFNATSFSGLETAFAPFFQNQSRTNTVISQQTADPNNHSGNLEKEHEKLVYIGPGGQNTWRIPLRVCPSLVLPCRPAGP